MPLKRGRILGYDADRVTFRFTMIGEADSRCSLSYLNQPNIPNIRPDCKSTIGPPWLYI